jgi:hypothetical protein
MFGTSGTSGTFGKSATARNAPTRHLSTIAPPFYVGCRAPPRPQTQFETKSTTL